ncbi:MAG TPA: DMT family transporter [Bacteroidetes bacterium]|nr:DMT family transporter [Bacteroidota bacterium]
MKKTKEKTEHIPPLAWLVLLGLGVVWGSSYILIKKSLIAFDPVQVACLRIGITSLCFLPFVLWQLKKVDWTKWKQLFIVGFIGSLVPAFLFSLAQTKISSSLTGILSSLTPLFTLLLGIAFFRLKSSWSKVIGVVLGLAGAIWLLVADRGIGDLEGMGYGMLVVAACFCYALSSNVVKAHLQDMPTFFISGVSYVMVGLPSIIGLFFFGFVETMKTQEHAWASLGYVSILAVSSTVLGSLFFFKLIKDTNVVFASTVSYLIPMVAILWGVFDGESITLWHFGGMASILVGVYVARK